MKFTILNCAKVCLLIALLVGTTFGAGYDLIEDGSIDWADVGAFAEKWLADCSVVDCGGANFYHANNTVDFGDFALFVNHWQTKDESIPPILWLFGSLRAVTMIPADTAAQLMVQLQAMR